MNKRCRGDEAVAYGSTVWHVKSGAAQGNSGINGQDAAGECGQDMRIQPDSEYGSLRLIPAFCKQYADFKLLEQ